MQLEFHTKSIFDEPQALEPHMDKSQIRTKKDNAKYAKVWALSERYD
jgi:hypothetical protein